MDRDAILDLEEKPLLELVEKNFNVKLGGLRDEEHLSDAWGMLETLVEKGWGFTIRFDVNVKSLDGYKFDNGPGTIFHSTAPCPISAACVKVSVRRV